MSGKVSHFADRFLGGSHDRSSACNMRRRSRYRTGPERLPLHCRRPDVVRVYAKALACGRPHPELRRLRGDTYRAGNLTLNLGLRFDHSKDVRPRRPPRPSTRRENATAKSSPGNDDVYHWDVVSAAHRGDLRVNSSGKTVIKRVLRQLYRGILLNDFTAAIPSVTPRYYFDITSSGARTNFDTSATTRT